MTDTNRRIAAIATGQLGAFTRAQANAAALTDDQLRGRVSSDRLIKTGVRTFRNPHAPTSLRTELSDLLLDVGDAWAFAPTAAAVIGLDGCVLRRPFHILVARGRNIQRVGVHVHTSSALPRIDRTVVDGLPVTSATRTLIDLAAIADRGAMRAAIASAFERGLSSERFLHERLLALRTRGRSGSRVLLDLLQADEIVAGRASWLERRFLELLAEAGLPRPDVEVTLTRAKDKLVRVDCHFRGTRVIVELLGYRWHRTRDQMQRDTERLNQLTLEGCAAFQFTYDQVVDDPAYVLDTVRRALATT